MSTHIRNSRSIRICLLSSCAALALPSAGSFAQEAQKAEELPPLEVTAKPQAKKANAKKANTAAPSSAAAQPTTEAASATGTSGQGQGQGTKPGLNLESPASTGSRLGLSPLETPASVEVVPGETIRDRGQQSVVDAVTQNATGFASAASPGNGGTALTARGFSGHGSVMQLYDGSRIYVGNGTVTFPFDTWSAERIEVLRGPASVLYGEGAIGGVINVVPKKPTDNFTHEGEVAIGTDATRRFGVGSGGPLADRLSYRFDASGIQSDGWLDRESDFSSIALSGALSYRATDDLKFTVSHDHGDQQPMRYFGTPLIDGKIPDRIRFKSYNVRDSDVSYVDNWTQFKTEWSPTDWLEVRNVAYRLTTNRHWRNAESYSYDPVSRMVDRTDFIEIFHDQEQFGNRMDATIRTALPGGMKNELVAGFDINQIDYRRTRNKYRGDDSVDPYNPDPGYFLELDPVLPEFDARVDQYSLFAEDRLTFSKQFTVVAGIRLDRPTVDRTHLWFADQSFERDFSETTWRAGAVYTPVPGLAFYGQYATGVDPVAGLVTLTKGSSEYELATGRQIEVGVKQSFWDGRGEWTFAAYDIEKQNLLSTDPNDPTDTRQVGQQSSRGVELTVALQITDTLRYEGNAALLRAEYDLFLDGADDYSGNVPNNVPEQIVNNWLSWAFLPDWEARVGVQWVGQVYANDANTEKRPDFTVVNLGLDYQVDDKSTISLRGFNVFDEVYATQGGDASWQLAPPRSAEISYRIRY
jgi:iron complex outermembrane receptor protein